MTKKSDTRARRIENWKFKLRFRERSSLDSRIQLNLQEALLRAAKEFDLDPDSELDRKLLLYVLADVAFGKVGRPRGLLKWDVVALVQLGEDCRRIERDFPKIKGARLAAKIKDLYPEVYRDTSVEMIRQKLGEARIAEEDYRENGNPEVDAAFRADDGY
jgi:hypothetical protein